MTLEGANLRAGSNRIITVQARSTGSSVVFSGSATFGGVAMTAGPNVGGGSDPVYSWYILEAALSALTVGTYDVVITSTGADFSSIHITVTQMNGAAQQAPEQTGTHAAASVESAPIALTSLTIGSAVVYDIHNVSDRGATIAVGGGLTESCPNWTVEPGGRGISGRLIADNASETPTATWTTATTTRGDAMAFAPAPSAPTFSSVIGGGDPGWGDLYIVQPQTLPGGTESAAYAGATLVPLNGQTPYTCSVTTGALPAGLALGSSTCAITGTPNAATAGVYNFTVEASDAGSGEAYQSFSITVDPATPGGGGLSFYEDGNDADDLTADPVWTAAGGCSDTANGTMEGSGEVSKNSAIACVGPDNVDAPEVFPAFDIYNDGSTNPTADPYQAFVGWDSDGNVLYQIGFETDSATAAWELFAFCPGMEGLFGGRGFFLGNLGAGESTYIEGHYLRATSGANGLCEFRRDGANLQTFTAGTATANVDRPIVFLDEHDGAATLSFDRVEVKGEDWPGRGPLTPGGDPGDPPDPQPWISGFTPVRQHYVDDVSCGGNGDIDTPECPATAFDSSHFTSGDLHILRTGNYLDSSSTTITKNCSLSSPCVWKAYSNPATGQPERATLKTTITMQGDHHWFVGVEITANSANNSDKGIEIRAAGTKMINNVVHDTANGTLMGVWDEGPGHVIYGNIGYRPAIVDLAGYNYYTQNDFATNGWKYYVQNMNFECRPGGGGSPFIFHGYTEGGRISGFHLQDNYWGGPCPGRMIFRDPNGPDNIKIHQDWFVEFGNSTQSIRGYAGPFQFEITNNYFARANFSPETYSGNVTGRNPIVFTGNEIYDPPNGDHIRTLTTKGTSGTDGSHKLMDEDEWDNNTYGGTFRAQLHANGTNFGNQSLAQWRTNTDASRETPASAVGFDINSTNPANPTVNKIKVTQNEWQCPACTFQDSDRGNIYIANWAAASTQQVDISPVVGLNKQYTVRYARDFYGTAAASGICPGTTPCNVTLPTKLTNGGSAGQFALAYVITAQP